MSTDGGKGGHPHPTFDLSLEVMECKLVCKGNVILVEDSNL